METCTNLPYGDDLNCTGYDPSPMHFTGAMRDTDVGLDYMHARYYYSTPGRWMLPDWSAVPVAVPYANLTNPQTLNLYTYVGNNPITHTDVDGHLLEGPPGGSGGSPASESTIKASDPTSANGPLQTINQKTESQSQSPAVHPKASGAKPSSSKGESSWNPSKPFPKNPSGLGPDWKPDRAHDPEKQSGDDRYVNDKTGDKIDWHKGNPNGRSKWDKRDHWHWVPGGNKEKGHYEPGDMIKKSGMAAGIGVAIGTAIHIIIETSPEWGPALAF